jgi:hypothetical protein
MVDLGPLVEQMAQQMVGLVLGRLVVTPVQVVQPAQLAVRLARLLVWAA